MTSEAGTPAATFDQAPLVELEPSKSAESTQPEQAMKPTALKTVYIVCLSMSGGSNIESREELDTHTEKTTMVFDRDTREKIGKVRSKFRSRIVTLCIPVFTMQVTKEERREAITRIVAEANAELQLIHESLSATVHFMPVMADQQAQGEAYNAITNAIRGQVFKTLLGRLSELAKQPSVPKRSRLALLDLCDRMKGWNVLDDPDVSRTIDEYRRQFAADVIGPVADEVKKEFDSLKSLGAFVEMD